jgi:hypothetical protein
MPFYQGALRRYVELAVPDAIQEAVPFMFVIHKHPACRIAGHAQQHPGDSVGRARHRHLQRSCLARSGPTRAPPGQAPEIDPEALGGRLPAHTAVLPGRHAACNVAVRRAPSPGPVQHPIKP